MDFNPEKMAWVGTQMYIPTDVHHAFRSAAADGDNRWRSILAPKGAFN